MMEEEKRGPGRPPKSETSPKMRTVRLLKGYWPHGNPDTSILAKKNAGEVLDLPDDEARALVESKLAELATREWL